MNKKQSDKLKGYVTIINSLTVLRGITEHGVIKSLNSFFSALASDDAQGASKCYHRLTQQLILSHSQRRFGCLFKDFIFEWLVRGESDFAAYAAMGGDVSDCGIFRRDTALLLDLAAFSTDDAEDLISGTSEMSSNDRIRTYTREVWGGSIDSGTNKGEKSVSLISWNTEELPAEEEEKNPAVYEARLAFSTHNADALADALISLYSSYGCGAFAVNRLFYAFGTDNFTPKESFLTDREQLPMLYPDEFERLSEVCTDFSGGTTVNTLLCGAHGLGKTYMLFALSERHTELNFVYVSAYDMPDFAALSEKISGQPGKYVLMIDDVENMHAIERFIGTFLQPENALIICVTENNIDRDCFDLVITLPVPDVVKFTRYIGDMLFTGVSDDVVRNFCMDYQIETKKPLSFCAIREFLRRM